MAHDRFSSRLAHHTRTLAVAVILALAFRTGIAQAYLVEGPSMQPTLEDGDRVFVVKYAYGLTLPFTDAHLLTWAEPEPGDVVIVRSPHDGLDLVKRVVGVAGDSIQVQGERVFRNGVPITTGETGECVHEDCEWTEERIGDHRWRTQRDPGSLLLAAPRVVVPEGHIYVLGDHRDRSNDSRSFGTIPVDRLRGRVVGLDD